MGSARRAVGWVGHPTRLRRTGRPRLLAEQVACDAWGKHIMPVPRFVPTDGSCHAGAGQPKKPARVGRLGACAPSWHGLAAPPAHANFILLGVSSPPNSPNRRAPASMANS